MKDVLLLQGGWECLLFLDPLDIFRMTGYLNCSFEQLLEERIELQVVDGMILPNLKMAGADEMCSF